MAQSVCPTDSRSVHALGYCAGAVRSWGLALGWYRQQQAAAPSARRHSIRAASRESVASQKTKRGPNTPRTPPTWNWSSLPMGTCSTRGLAPRLLTTMSRHLQQQHNTQHGKARHFSVRLHIHMHTAAAAATDSAAAFPHNPCMPCVPMQKADVCAASRGPATPHSHPNQQTNTHLKKFAPSLSILLTKQMRGTLYLSAWRHTVSDWGSTPDTASNTATAPSSTRSARSTYTTTHNRGGKASDSKAGM